MRASGSGQATISDTVSLPEELGEHPAFLLGRARLELVKRMDALLQPSGVASRHFVLALLLSRRPGLSQVQVSQLLGTDRTTTMKMARELEVLGMLRRRRSLEDRRHYALTLLPKGKRWLDRLLPVLQQASDAFLSPLSPGEQNQLRRSLFCLVSHAC